MPACPELMSTPVCAFAGSPGYLPAARVGSHGTIHVHGNRIRSSEPCYENKMKIRLALRILLGLCCLLLLLVNTGDYVQFTKHPELYPMGGEGLGWTYESHENHTLACLLAIVWDIIGIISSACHRFRYSGKILLIHAVLTLIMILCYWLCLYCGFYC